MWRFAARRREISTFADAARFEPVCSRGRETTDDIRVSADAGVIARNTATLLVPTIRTDGRAAARARRSAAVLASRHDVSIVLYDRTSESRFVDPYPDLPFDTTALLATRDALPSGWSWLSTRVFEIERHGVDVRVCFADSTPASMDALLARMDEYAIGAVLVPADQAPTGVRLGSRDFGAAGLADTIGRPVLVVDRAGNIGAHTDLDA